MNIPITHLRQKLIATLNENFTQEQASRIADALLWGEMSGIKSQGIIKLRGNHPIQAVKPQHEIRVERDTTLSQLINAGAYPAPLVSQQATDTVIQKAQEHGFGIVGVYNTFSSSLALAFYAERIAKADLIGIVMARASADTAPFDSIDALFGTNPLAFSFPTNDEPFIFDMATSAMTFYDLVMANTRGDILPEGIAIDKTGNPTTDPAAAMKGALLPFDRGYKGSGLGMVIEIMAGPLINSAYCDSETFDKEWGNTFIAIDPNLLVDVDQFKTNCSDLIAKIKAARKKPGITEIRLPGERSRAARKAAEASGMVEVDEAILRELGHID